MTLNELLIECEAPASLATVLHSIADACAEISVLACDAGSSKAGTTNAFGDAQLEIDLAAEEVIFNHLSKQPSVAVVASEEHPEERVMHEDGEYSIAFDPLDGSSIVACNWTVGSIVGKKLNGVSGKELVASIVCVYGPRCTLWLCTGDKKGANEMTWTSGGVWMRTDSVDTMKQVKVYAPANLRASQDDEAYSSLVDYFMRERYTLRYSGGLVPDVCQLLTRRGGIFLSPVSSRAKAKLRTLYEVMPMALLIEAGGGMAVDDEGERVLDRIVSGLDERIGFCCGEKSEVERFVQARARACGAKRHA